MKAPSSATIRLLPSPGSPTIVTSWTAVRSDGLVEDPLEQREIDLPTDEWGVVCPGEVGAEAGPGGLRVEDANRFGLALEGGRLELGVVEDRSRGLVGGEPDRDAHLRGDRL